MGNLAEIRMILTGSFRTPSDKQKLIYELARPFALIAILVVLIKWLLFHVILSRCRQYFMY